MDCEVSKSYGIRVVTIDAAIDSLIGDLDYLCNIIEDPEAGYVVKDAVVYSIAVVAIMDHLDFAESLTNNEVSRDGNYIKLSEEELVMMSDYTHSTEAALKQLEEICGISIKTN